MRFLDDLVAPKMIFLRFGHGFISSAGAPHGATEDGEAIFFEVVACKSIVAPKRKNERKPSVGFYDPKKMPLQYYGA